MQCYALWYEVVSWIETKASQCDSLNISLPGLKKKHLMRMCTPWPASLCLYLTVSDRRVGNLDFICHLLFIVLSLYVHELIGWVPWVK